jgi:protein-L-isoaspartate(D-aspartate) O-methyltransferase
MENANWEKLVNNLVHKGTLRTSSVIKAMQTVPRVKFLPANEQPYSDRDTPLQIGYGQTVCAPHTVSAMNEALQLQVGNKLLEVGSGCGWHATMLAEIVAPSNAPRSEWGHVYTVEIHSGLAEMARRNIMNAGYGDRVTIICRDGYSGFAEKAPFDRIIVNAAAAKVPPALLSQLKTNGLLLMPVGNSLFQSLQKLTKTDEGQTKQESLGIVTFIPMSGEAAN